MVPTILQLTAFRMLFSGWSVSFDRDVFNDNRDLKEFFLAITCNLMPKLGLTRSAVNNRLYVNTGVIYKDDGTVKVLNMGVKRLILQLVN